MLGIWLSCTCAAFVGWYFLGRGGPKVGAHERAPSRSTTPTLLHVLAQAAPRAVSTGRMGQSDTVLAASLLRRALGDRVPAALGGSSEGPERRKPSGRLRRRYRRNDPFRSHRAVVGDDARLQWWERMRALLILPVIVLLLGAAVAAFIGLGVFVGTLLIELLAS